MELGVFVQSQQLSTSASRTNNLPLHCFALKVGSELVTAISSLSDLCALCVNYSDANDLTQRLTRYAEIAENTKWSLRRFLGQSTSAPCLPLRLCAFAGEKVLIH